MSLFAATAAVLDRRQSSRPSERNRDAERKQRVRFAERDLTLPPVADPKRRAKCERDIFRFLPTYFPETFYQPFTDQRSEMVRAILTAAKHGGDQAIAAPRADGKTTIAECVAIFCILKGLIRFPLIAAATGPDAQRILDHIKQHLERSDQLAADYPEVCFPIRALKGAPQAAGAQTVNGQRTYLRWAQDHVILPTIAGSRASGAVIITRGLDSAIRGIRVGLLRPDLVLIDDPETRESVTSETQTDTRQLTIEEDLAGLGGGDKKLARVMLTTLMRRESLSATYTDRAKKPSWKGQRFRLLKRLPTRIDLWEEYCSMRETGFRTGDEHARSAHQFYLDHRAEMDAGAQLGNPARFNGELLADGTQAEASALQRCYNIIADRGQEHFDCEYQNDPPEEAGPVESGITAERIQRQVSGYPRFVVPPGCTVLTQGIDVGKYALHYVVKAWRPDATGFVIDYDVQDVHGTSPGNDEATDRAIVRALYARREAMLAEPYATADGEIVEVGRTVIDAGYRTPAVYHFCRESGVGFHSAMGFGKSSGCTQANFRPPARPSADKRPGDGWFLSRRPKGIWLLCMDTDRWKSWEHDRWMSPPDGPGACLLWGERSDDKRLSDDQKAHFTFSKHLTAEIEIEDPTRDRGMVRKWKVKRDGNHSNHYFDASYMANVAANMSGISLLKSSQPKQQHTGGWFAAQQQKKRR